MIILRDGSFLQKPGENANTIAQSQEGKLSRTGTFNESLQVKILHPASFESVVLIQEEKSVWAASKRFETLCIHRERMMITYTHTHTHTHN